MLINRAFFRDYWQKKPLVLRNAVNLPETHPGKEALFSLAGDENIESRLVLEHGERPWEVHFGPFTSAELEALPNSGWTILFQDMDKHLPEVGSLLEQFRGMPRWRIDDIMISYAVDKGSVGPHTDEYDVFLIQASGKRLWRIDTDPEADRSLVANLDMKILQHFEAEQELLLEPGDMLYLPPGVAHWGIARGECITWSVGFRAPSARELLPDWAEAQQQVIEEHRYSDPELELQVHDGEIQPQALIKLQRMLLRALEQDAVDFGAWFGRYITEPKEHLQPVPAPDRASPAILLERMQEQPLTRHPASRILFMQNAGRLYLFCGGRSYPLPESCLSLAVLLSEQDTWDHDELRTWLDNEDAAAMLIDLFERGYLGFD
ncbi:MAG: cupin domain-containing protein [Chromatiales bacterium]|jgi:50S ribosomal protein L16 3-hydroxylase